MLNQNPNTFTFNGVSSADFGIRIERKPDLNRSGRKFKSASVSGRNGNIYQLQDAWEEVVVAYDIYAGGTEKGDAIPAFTDIMEWLNSADGYAVLTDSYDPLHYRMAVFVDAVDIESQWHTIGQATIKFRCRPQRYLTTSGNILPKIDDADVRGIISINTTNNTSQTVTNQMLFTLESPLTITQNIVDASNYLYLNNTVPDKPKIFFQNASNTIVLSATPNSTNYKVLIPQAAVGETITKGYIEVIVPAHTTIIGTVKPEIKCESSTVSVANGESVYNSTNHAALPIITLTGTQIIPNLLDLEATYTYPLDASGYDVWTDWFLSYMGFCNLATYSNGTKTIGMYSSSSVSTKGGSLSAHSNSTGTLTFKSWLNMGGDVGVGVGATLTPDTDYTISCTTTSGNSKIQAIFFNSESPKSLNSIAEASRSGAGTLTLTFHVPVICSNVLFMFYRPDNTSGSFTSIMLNTGTTAAPFVAYGGESTDSITINDTTLSFNHRGFTEAVIDCEKENFTIDGVASNNKARLLDQYGNLSDEYLQLTKGSNNVSYTANISSVSFVPHYWEL